MNIVALFLRIIIIITVIWKIYALLKINSYIRGDKLDVKVRLPLEVIFSVCLVLLLTYVDEMSLFRKLFKGELNAVVIVALLLMLTWIIYTIASIYEISHIVKLAQMGQYINNACDPERALMMTFLFIVPGIIYVTGHLNTLKHYEDD